jgi:hypothetical protein
MDVWLLGGAAIVLIAITLWIVWPSRNAEADIEPTPSVESAPSPEVKVTTPAPSAIEPAPVPSAYQAAGEPWSSPTITHEPTADVETLRPQSQPPSQQGGKVSIGAAVIIALTGAIGGAWLYARWRRRQSRPIKRLRKRFFR